MHILGNSHPAVVKFVEYVEDQCDIHNVKLDIRNTKYIWCNGARVSGFFEEGEPATLRVSGKHTMALEIFIHEYSHMTQWLDKNSIWYEDSLDHNKLAPWLAGKRVHHINDIIDEIRDLEVDNEKRTVKLMKKFKLPIDIKAYIKQANAYMFFHEHLKNTRRWSTPKNSPYKNKRITNAMPDRFVRDYTTYFEKVRHIYEEENI